MKDDLSYYYGNAENKLNSKGQVAIPARFRTAQVDDEASRSYVIIPGERQCLYMYTHRQFATIKDNAKRVAEESGDDGFYRSFMAEALPVDIDTQGRFVLPPAFMKMAGIMGPSVLFIGIDERIELWEPGVYAATKSDEKEYREKRRSNARRIFGI